MTTTTPTVTDAQVLDQIAEMLREPDWGVGMLEDINTLVSQVRNTETIYYIEGPWLDTLLEREEPLDPTLREVDWDAPSPEDTARIEGRAFWGDGFWTDEDNRQEWLESQRRAIKLPTGGRWVAVNSWDRH